MSQAILISNNDVVNSMYEVNLKAYVATNVTVKSNISEAVDLLQHAPDMDAIICYLAVGDSPSVKDLSKLKDLLNEKSINIPFIVLGKTNHEFDHMIQIPNRYDIKSLLQAMAKILEITAKEMAALPVPKYFPIPIKLFSQMQNSYCDVFTRSSRDDFEYDYNLVFQKEAEFGEKLKALVDKGTTHLYVDSNERLRFINHTSKTVVGELERDDLSSEERFEITGQAMGVVAEEVFENPKISEELASISNSCIESIKGVVKKTPKLKNMLDMLMRSQTGYIYKHSVIATFIANQIISKISWGSQEQKDKIAFSLFFHDIFLLPIYEKYPDVNSEEDLLFKDDVADEDKKVVLDHAKLAAQLVRTFPRCPMGADMIITQHHGMTSGQGFAINYKDDISPLSKVMIIAEEITANVLEGYVEGQKLKIDKKALATSMSEKFRISTYRKIIDAFVEADF